MNRNTWKKGLALLAVGAIPLVTQANCDPYGGYFFRDDDSDSFVDVYYDDPCYWDGCYYEDVYYVEDVYYGP